MAANETEKPSEVERATSYSLLIAINLLPANAKRLSAQKRFLEIRQAVAHWWMNRFSAGGKFDDEPGIPAMDQRFLQDDFGRRWRTKAESEAEQLEQEQKEAEQRQLLAEIEQERQAEEQPADAPIPPDADTQDLWQHALKQLEASVPASTFTTWLKDTHALGWQEETLLIATPNSYACEWLQSRLRPMVKRLLTLITGQSVNIRFVVSSVPIVRPEDT